jgi:hypothetical protein
MISTLQHYELNGFDDQRCGHGLLRSFKSLSRLAHFPPPHESKQRRQQTRALANAFAAVRGALFLPTE